MITFCCSKKRLFLQNGRYVFRSCDHCMTILGNEMMGMNGSFGLHSP